MALKPNSADRHSISSQIPFNLPHKKTFIYLVQVFKIFYPMNKYNNFSRPNLESFKQGFNMPKANLTLNNGTKVSIEGTIDEVKCLLDFYNGASKRESVKIVAPNYSDKKSKHALNIIKIVNEIKNCEEAENIEKNILNRISQVNRILLPLYIINQYMNNEYFLSSGDINRITIELGIPIHVANVSRTLSGAASKYVVANRPKKKGRAVGYKLSHRGLNYVKGIIKEK